MTEKRYKESDPFYHSTAWKRLRRMALERDRGMCCECMHKYQMGIMRHPHAAPGQSGKPLQRVPQ